MAVANHVRELRTVPAHHPGREPHVGDVPGGVDLDENSANLGAAPHGAEHFPKALTTLFDLGEFPPQNPLPFAKVDSHDMP